MAFPEGWELPLSVFRDQEGSRSPRPDLMNLRIQDLDIENPPSIFEIAQHIVVNSDIIPERYYQDFINWIEEGFDRLGENWQEWLLKVKPSGPLDLKSIYEDEFNPEEVETEIEAESPVLGSSKSDDVSATTTNPESSTKDPE